jgi:hypothetical protein
MSANSPGTRPKTVVIPTRSAAKGRDLRLFLITLHPTTTALSSDNFRLGGDTPTT